MEWGLGRTTLSGMWDDGGLFICMGLFFERVHYTKKPYDGEQNHFLRIVDRFCTVKLQGGKTSDAPEHRSSPRSGGAPRTTSEEDCPGALYAPGTVLMPRCNYSWEVPEG